MGVATFFDVAHLPDIGDDSREHGFSLRPPDEAFQRVGTKYALVYPQEIEG